MRATNIRAELANAVWRDLVQRFGSFDKDAFAKFIDEEGCQALPNSGSPPRVIANIAGNVVSVHRMDDAQRRKVPVKAFRDVQRDGRTVTVDAKGR
jgi:hypothetical protein